MKKNFTNIVTALLLILVGSTTSYAQYCIPDFTNVPCTSPEDWIENFTFANISNLNTGCNANAENFIYYNTPALTAQVIAGSTYNITMQSGQIYAQGFHVWIDFNQDFDFEDAGESVYMSPTFGKQTYSGTVTIPLDAKACETRIRVRCKYNSVVNANQICETFVYGETEDYNVEITAANPLDIGALKLNNPRQILPLVPVTISMDYQNYGNQPIDSARVGYIFNNQPPVKRSISAIALAKCESQTYEFTDNPEVALLPGIYPVKIWANYPNGVSPDGDITNDTLNTFLCTPLSMEGVFTLDRNGSGSKNFESFARLSEALATCGVISNVTVNVAPGFYDTGWKVKEILGSHPGAVVTVQSATGDADDVVIFADAGNTVFLDSTNFLTIKNITIENSGILNSRGVAIKGLSTNIILDSVIVKVSNTATSSSIKAIETQLGSGPSGFADIYPQFITIKNSTISGGYYAIDLNGYSAAHPQGFIIDSNIINEFRYYGVYAQYIGFQSVTNNTIVPRTSQGLSSYCFYMNTCSTSTGMQMNNNRFINSKYRALYMSSFTSTQKSTISNNIFSVDTATNSAASAVYMSSVDSVLFAHNSLYLDGSSSSDEAMYLTGTHEGLEIYNNIIANYGSGIGYYIYSTSSGFKSDNNILYAASGNIGYFSGNKTTIESFISASGSDFNSSSLDPEYVSSTDLHVQNIKVNGLGKVIGIEYDIDEEFRNPFLPDPGCDEITPHEYDLAITQVSPQAPTYGPNAVSVYLLNNGKQSLASETVILQYSTNGGASFDVSETVALTPLNGPNTFFQHTFITPWNNEDPANYFFCVRVLQPGVVLDTIPENESICLSGCALASITDSLFVGELPGDFATISEALNAIECGIIQPIVISVRPGTYPGSVFIGEINGASNLNTITIESITGNAEDVIIESEAGFVFQLYGTDFLTIRNLTLVANASDDVIGVHITNQANFNTIEGCIIHLDSNSTSPDIIGIGCITSVTSSGGDHGNSVSILNNEINGGYYGIQMYGTNQYVRNVGGVINGNKLYNQYYSGIYIDYNDMISISDNLISLRTSVTTTSGYGIRMNYSISDLQLTGNTIINPRYYGMYLTTVTGPTQVLIANNIISGEFKNSYARGIHVATLANGLIVNNSIQVNSTGSYSACLIAAGTNSFAIRNNNFSQIGDGWLIYISANPETIIDCDYNNYYTEAFGKFNYWAGTASSSFAAHQVATGLDVNSYNIKPNFRSFTDLHMKDPNFDDLGNPELFVTDDIDKDVRDTEAPDIGADEFKVFPIDLVCRSVDNEVLIQGSNKIKFTLANEGTTSLNGNTASMSFSIDSGQNWSTAENFSLTSLLNFDDQQSFEFAAAVNIPNNQKRDVCIKINTPITGDGDLLNDQLCVERCVGLFGTYTVGGGIADFLSLGDALAALSCGVGGPVVFNLNNGIYSERMVLSNVPGLSEINTVTFQSASGNNKDVTITYNGTSSSSHSVIQFRGSNYYTVKNVTITGNGSSYQSGVHFTSDARYNTVEGCKIIVDSTSTSSYFGGIIFSTQTSMISSGKNGSYNNIINNEIIGGYYGIRMYGLSATHDIGNVISGNTFSGFYYYGNYIYYNDEITVDSNYYVPRASAASYVRAMFVAYSDGDGSITRNTYSRNLYSAMYLVYVYPSTEFIIANNMFGEGESTTGGTSEGGFVISACTNLSFYHNSFNYTNVNIDAAPLKFISTSASGMRVFNNIFQNTADGYAMYVASSGIVAESDHNIFNTNGSDLIFFGGNMATLSDYQSTSGFDGNSMNASVEYLSGVDLHTKDVTVNDKGASISVVKKDFDGKVRKTNTPDIGAVEFEPTGFDLAVVGVLPGFPKLGTNTVQVVLRNDGLLSLNDSLVTLAYSTDGGDSYSTPQQYTISGLLNTFDHDTVDFALPWNVPTETNYELCAKVVTPIKSDTINDNELFCKLVCVAKSGLFTIGSGIGMDFLTITDALNSIDCGINGPVTLSVAPGTYNEQVNIPLINNASDINTVTIESSTGNPQDVIIDFGAGTTSDFWTVRFNGARYVTLKNVTIINNASSYAVGVHFTNGSTENSLIGNVIKVDSSSTTSTIYGINASSATSITGSGNNMSNTTIKGNKVYGGYYGITLRGTSTASPDVNNHIDSNIIQGQYYFGMYFYYQSMKGITNNTVQLRDASSTNSRGIYMVSSKGDFDISNNRFYNVQYNGIYFSGVDATNEIRIINNFFGTGYGSSSAAAAFYLTGSSNLTIANNSVNFDGSSPSGQVVYVTYGNDNLKFINNSFANFGGGYVYYIFSAYISAVVESENNNLYSTGPNLTYWGTATTSLEDHQNTSGKDKNSVSADPQYFSGTDLHSLSEALDKGAQYIVGIDLDIDGDSRSTIKPDIGADEFVLSAIDLGIIDVKPTVAAFGNNEISMTLINEGIVSLEDSVVSFSYSVDGGTIWSTPETYSIQGLEESFDSENFTFTQKWVVTEGKDYNVCVRVETGPIGDDYLINDTSCVDVCVGVSGGIFTIGGLAPDYNTLNDAVNSISCGVTGDVIFDIRTGTYLERLTLGDILKGQEYTITFRSSTGSPDDVVISSPGGGNDIDHHTIQFNGTYNIIFDKVTVINTSVQRASAIHFNEGTHDVTISNSIIKVDSLNGFNTVTPITFSGNTETYFDPVEVNNIRVENNIISGGYYGVRVIGIPNAESEGIIIKNNRFYRTTVSAIRTQYATIDTLSGNRIVMRNTNDQNVGIYLDRPKNKMIIDANHISFAGSIGILLSNDDNGSVISNNMIAGGFRPDGIDGDYGIGLKNCDAVEILHNSVIMDGEGLDATALYIDNSFNIKNANNIYYNNQNGLAYLITNGDAFVVSENNDLFTNGSVLIDIEGATYLDLISYSSATLSETNSKSVEPLFNAPFDLHLNQAAFSAAGMQLTNVLTDFDGDMRDSDAPDIGADEFELDGFVDGGIKAFVSPINNEDVTGPVTITVTIGNYGTEDVSGFSVTYEANGESVTESVFDNIPANTEYNYTFEEEWYPNSFSDMELCAYTSIFDDVDLDNDQVCITVKSLDTTDIEISSIVTPDNIIYGYSSDVIVNLTNNGSVAISDFPVIYVFDGEVVTEQFSGTLNPKETKSFEFIEDIVVASEGVFDFCAYIGVDDDIDLANDSICYSIQVIPDTIDVQALRFVTPGTAIDSSLKPIVEVKNGGNSIVSKFDVALIYQGFEVDRATITSGLASGTIIEHQFSFTVSPVTGTTFDLVAIVELFGDINKLNDSTSISTTSFGANGVDNIDGFEMNLYPNPVSDVLRIEGIWSLNELPFNIVTITGELVTQGVFTQDNPTIDLTSLESGTYLINMNIEEAIITRKLEVIH
ncbi:MAG: hypothetical protein ACJAZ3_000512 [Sphingobacteriales bacterium]|jgi:hypothetical protein